LVANLATIVGVAAVALWVHLYEFNEPNTWDAAQLLTQSKLLQRGLLLYRDVWEMKPPGVFLYQRAVFGLLGTAPWSLRLSDYVLYVAAGVVFFRLCAREARWPLAFAGTAIWLFFAHHPAFNNQGFYTEEYTSMCAIGAVAAAAGYARTGQLRWAAASGIAVAGAVLFKHPGIACAVPVTMLITARRPLRALPLAALSGALPLLLVIGYFWWHGALAEFIDCNFKVLVAYGGISQPGGPDLTARLAELAARTWERFAAYPGVVTAVLFGAAVCLLHPNRFRVAALSWLLADLLMIMAQSHYFEHYFIQLFPSAILVATLGAAWLLQRRPGEGWSHALARVALCIVVVTVVRAPIEATIAKRQPRVKEAWRTLRAGRSAWIDHPGGNFEVEIGRYLKEHTAPDDRVFVYADGTGAAIYWSADRLPASRYLYPSASQLSLAREAEQRAELARTPPAYVAIGGSPVPHHFTPLLLADYTLAAVKERDYRVEIWARNESVQFASGEIAGLVADPKRDGLALAKAPTPDEPAQGEAAETRKGVWISPVVEVVGDGDLSLDWSLGPQPGGAGPSAAMPAAGAPGAPGTAAEAGAVVSYRAGQTADLSASPWVALQDGEKPHVPADQRYVQVRCELWTRDGGDPVLRAVRIGRLRFQLDGANAAGRAPLRTAQQAALIAAA
jgi:hypothetical protein